MKKILLAALLGLFFTACSNDDGFGDTEENAVTYNDDKSMAARAGGGGLFPDECFDEVYALAHVELPNGLSNPEIVFELFINQYGKIPNRNYRTRLEMETLVDCEDLARGTGTVITFRTLGYNSSPMFNSPKFSLTRRQLPASCFRWRMIIEGMSSSGTVICTSATDWYDEPLF